MPTITTNSDGSYTITVPAPVAPVTTFVPTEEQVQAAVDAGIIAAYTPVAQG